MKTVGRLAMTLIFDPGAEGLAKVLKDYQIEALRLVWSKGDDGTTSKEAWQHANQALRGVRTISRASVINFLNDMVEEGVLNRREETCRGGSRGVYSPRMSEREFKKHIAEMVVTSLIRDFPEETEEKLKELQLIS